MKSIAKFSVLLLMVAFFATACGKYEEGPKLSLASKKARIVNTWVVNEITVDKVAQTLTDEQKKTTTEFKKDNTVTFSYEGFSVNGNWELSDNKEDLIIKMTLMGVTESDTSKILRLKSNEMWLEDTYGTHVQVTKFESKK